MANLTLTIGGRPLKIQCSDNNVEAVKENITKEVNETIVKMMDEMGTLIKSDEMGELLSAIKTKEAFGDFDKELGEK